MSSGTILVVDDNLDHARTVEMSLVHAGHKVLVAVNAQEAAELLDADPSIDLVVSDVRMPDIDGFSLVRMVRHRYPAVAVLLMSAFAWSREDVIPAGVTILRKPFGLDVLDRAIETVRAEAPNRQHHPRSE